MRWGSVSARGPMCANRVLPTSLMLKDRPGEENTALLRNTKFTGTAYFSISFLLHSVQRKTEWSEVWVLYLLIYTLLLPKAFPAINESERREPNKNKINHQPTKIFLRRRCTMSFFVVATVALIRPPCFHPLINADNRRWQYCRHMSQHRPRSPSKQSS